MLIFFLKRQFEKLGLYMGGTSCHLEYASIIEPVPNERVYSHD